MPILRTFDNIIIVSRYCLKFFVSRICSDCRKGPFKNSICGSGGPIFFSSIDFNKQLKTPFLIFILKSQEKCFACLLSICCWKLTFTHLNEFFCLCSIFNFVQINRTICLIQYSVYQAVFCIKETTSCQKYIFFLRHF